LSTVKTIRFKTEKIRNITIKLGYANAKIYKCKNTECYRPGCYTSAGSQSPDEINCENCSQTMELVRHVSFVDW
jgi:translation initiation factor 2 subunit 3